MNDLGFCIHGHFYQPPREDPLTGHIPVEPGAAPYQNWNEKINAQCYKPNAALGNFARISFNLGPTLLEWMREADPQTLATIVAQDRRNLRENGVGNGMAQAYSHAILPLASRRDKKTQVLWGLADFAHRFGHAAQGMWLPETAADQETLSVLRECGVEFTILAPWQADAEHIDPSQPHLVRVSGGKSITVFFYNQDLSTRVSFDPAATVDAGRFALENVVPKFRLHKGRVTEDQLVMIASDGELYGHHQPFRDQFLAYLLGEGLKSTGIQTTYPGLWLKQHPATKEVAICQPSSWSCHHGVTRWMGDCACTAHNEWKSTLREALNAIGDAVDGAYERAFDRMGFDPWETRNDFIQVVLEQIAIEDFTLEHTSHSLNEEQIHHACDLLWAQYERQRMFTSCGWFFDDFERIEPRNNVAYAAQAVWLTRRASGIDLTQEAARLLKAVVSHRSGLRGDQVFLDHIRRADHNWAR